MTEAGPSEYIYSAVYEHSYRPGKPDRIELYRVPVIRRSPAFLLVRRHKATGYHVRLDPGTGRDLNLGATPEEAIGALRQRLGDELARLRENARQVEARIQLAAAAPPAAVDAVDG